jgi:hypothetical protein
MTSRRCSPVPEMVNVPPPQSVRMMRVNAMPGRLRKP